MTALLRENNTVDTNRRNDTDQAA